MTIITTYGFLFHNNTNITTTQNNQLFQHEKLHTMTMIPPYKPLSGSIFFTFYMLISKRQKYGPNEYMVNSGLLE